MSDNGPPFSSAEFKQFMLDWDVKHTTSSSNYLRLNGLAERTVQTIKNT